MLIFLYFLALSADLINLEVGIFRAKVSHLVALVLFTVFFLKHKKIILDRAIFSVFLLLLAAFLLSAALSSYPMRCFTYVGVFLFNFLFYFLLPINLLLQEESKRVLKLYFLSFGVIGAYAVLQFFLSLSGVVDPFVQQRIGEWARPNGLSYEPSYYALYMTAYVMFLNFYFLFGGVEGKKWSLILANLFLAFSFSTGGFFAYFVFFGIAFFLLCQKKIRSEFTGVGKRALKLFLSFLGTLVLGVVLLEQIFAAYFFKFFNAYFYENFSFEARWEGIKSGFTAFLSNPFFGKGVGGVGPYLYRAENPESTAVNFISLEHLELYDPTNVTMEILSSLGVLGLVGFCLLACLFLRKFRTAQRMAISEEERKTAYALFLSLIVLLIELQFNQNLFRSYIWVHCAMTYGFLAKLERETLLPTRFSGISQACTTYSNTPAR